MKFSVGPQFSREFSLEDKLIIINDLNDTLNKCFAEKKNNSEIEKMYIAVICVSKGFEPFFKAKPLKVSKKEQAIEYEIKLEFETFYKANVEEKIKILHHEFLTQSKEILNDKKIKKIDLTQFLSDLEECLNQK